MATVKEEDIFWTPYQAINKSQLNTKEHDERFALNKDSWANNQRLYTPILYDVEFVSHLIHNRSYVNESIKFVTLCHKIENTSYTSKYIIDHTYMDEEIGIVLQTKRL